MTQSGRRTLRDVAVAAGVSEMTVSRVLSGTGVVSERTRARVRAAVDDMGYVRNRLAGSLARARSDQVAVVIPSLVNAIFDEVIDGLSQELSRADYNPVIGISDYDEAREEALIRSMLSWRPAGVVLPAIGHTVRTTAMLGAAGVPIVEIMNTGRPSAGIAVGFDQREAGAALGRHLLSRGRRRVGWIGLDPRDLSASARLDGLCETLRGVASVMLPKAVAGPITLSGGRDGLAALLAERPDLDAVVFANDTAAAGGMMHCLAAGIAVPERLALVGFGGLLSGQALPRRLTTIAAPRRRIGQRAATCILRSLEGAQVERINDMGFDLIQGETT